MGVTPQLHQLHSVGVVVDFGPFGFSGSPVHFRGVSQGIGYVSMVLFTEGGVLFGSGHGQEEVGKQFYDRG